MVNLKKVRERARKRQDNLDVILSTLKEQLKEVSDILSDTKVQSGYKGSIRIEVQNEKGEKDWLLLKVVAGKVALINLNGEVKTYLYAVLNDTDWNYKLNNIDLNTLVDAWIEFVNEHLTKLNTLKKVREKLTKQSLPKEIVDAMEEID